MRDYIVMLLRWYVKGYRLTYAGIWPILAAGGSLPMTAKKPSQEREGTNKSTSLNIDRAVYRRAWDYKLDTGKDLGDIVSEALDEYLKKRGA
jgi:hypothetical protein